MKVFSEFKKENINGCDSKWDFATKAMDNYHKILWDYARVIEETDIHSIILKEGRVIVELLSGVKLYCREFDSRSMPMDILNFNEYEKDQMHVIYKILTKLEHRNIIDIGANIGYTSCSWAKQFTDAKIWAYEPIKSTYELLVDNVNLNNCSSRIVTCNVGISDKNMETDFYFYPWCTANTSINNLQHRKDAVIEHARLNRLDDREELKKVSIDFIKCDVEGNELFVIEGAHDIIEKNLPIISIEILRKYSKEFGYEANDVVRSIKKYGYSLYCARYGNLVEIEEISDDTKETNFIFMHRDKHQKLLEVLDAE